MAPTPKTKAEDLTERANAFLAREEQDQFTLAKLKREAVDLIKSDPFDAHIVLGMFSAAEKEIDQVRKHYGTALKIFPNDFSGNHSFSSALIFLGYLSESLEFAEKACQQRPEDGEVLADFLDGLMFSGRLQEAESTIEKLLKLKQELPENTVTQVRDGAKFLRENGVADDDIGQLVDLTVSVLRERLVLFEKSRFEVMEDEESEFLGFLFEVHRPVEEIVELNYEAAKKLAAAPELDDTGDFVIGSFTSSIPVDGHGD